MTLTRTALFACLALLPPATQAQITTAIEETCLIV